MADAPDPATKRDEHERQSDAIDQSAVVGVSAAAGRDHFIGGQISQAEASARSQSQTRYEGGLYRATWPQYTEGYSNHSQADPGRYNLPGQSALYTAPTIADVRAESANYRGLDGKAVVRSHFQGDLLDLRQTPGVTHDALTQGYGGPGEDGKSGRMRSLLTKVTGEDPYTLPRALGDVARERGLSGVIAPANHGNTNVALFPDSPNGPARAPGRIEGGLRAVDHRTVTGDTPGPATAYTQPHPHVRDTTPHKQAPPGIDLNPTLNPHGKVTGREGYLEKVEDDVADHARAGGLRYGAAGAALGEVAEGLTHGHVDGSGAVANVALGGVAGHAETALAHRIDRAIHPLAPPPNVAGASGIEMPAEVSRLRPPGLAAGALAGGAVGGAVGAALATWQDADAVRTGRMSAGHATADVAVQAGIGMGSGMAAAAAGAAVGSVVPVVGTAAGAVAGFGVGIGMGLAAEHSAALHAGEQALGDALTRHAEQPLQHVWRGVAAGVDAVKGPIASAEHGVVETAKSAGAGAKQAAVSGWHRLMGSAAAQAPTSTSVEDGARSLWAAQAEKGRQLMQERATPEAAAAQTQGAVQLASAGRGLRLR